MTISLIEMAVFIRFFQELSNAISAAAAMSPDLSVDKIEINPANVASAMVNGPGDENSEISSGKGKKTKKKKKEKKMAS